MAARSARGFGAGALSIVLALDLAGTGYSALAIGIALGLALAFASVWALAAPRLERRWGRRSVLGVGAAALAAGGFLLWTELEQPVAVIAALALGGIVAGSSDVSPLGALEQAALADRASTTRQTETFAAYNLVGYVGGAFGALVAGPLTSLSTAAIGGGIAPAHDTAILFYGLLGGALIPTYLGLSREVGRHVERAAPVALSPESKRRVYALASLFSVDAFGGGLIINSLVVYYLAARFAPPVELLGALFFLGNVTAALSLALAIPIARRVGLIRTMVFTHLPSSVLLIAFAFAPGFLIAAAVWVARSTLSQMDVPTRQAFTQAVVPPRERATAAGMTTAARSASALGGPVTGALLGAGGPWVAGPFVLAGTIKIAYDLAIYTRFRDVGAASDAASETSAPPRGG